MTNLPKRPVELPAALACLRNGYLNSLSLAPIGHGGSLAIRASRCWAAMWLLAQSAGIELTWTPGGTYRPYWAQVALFTQRWDNHKRVGPTVFYGGQQWWLKPGVARAAVPGLSYHGWGLAIDVALGTQPALATAITPALPWLLQNALDLGWSWETDAEPWHLHFFPGDVLPQRVLDVEAEFDVPTPAA